MSVEVYVKMHIECVFRNDQNKGDDFELYLGHHLDPFWLSRTEVVQLVERAIAALAAYDRAKSVLRAQAHRRDPTEDET